MIAVSYNSPNNSGPLYESEPVIKESEDILLPPASSLVEESSQAGKVDLRMCAIMLFVGAGVIALQAAEILPTGS